MLNLAQLYAKYHAGTLTEEERAQFRRTLNDPANEELLHELLDADWDAIREEELEDVTPEKAEAIFRAAIGQPFKTRRLWPRIAAAASILLILSAGGYFLLKPKAVQPTAPLVKNDIAPGHQQATLTLANGKKIVLTKGLRGILATQGKTTIQASNNNIAYSNTKNEDQVSSYNTMSTAKGEQSPYPLVLADGTKVWLNAESSITFPTAFNQKERIVKLIGEAYFEVAHNAKQPFKVLTDRQTIEDIGTQFDANTYANEQATRTTLVQGKVKVTASGITQQITLDPGNQSILAGNQLTAKAVNTGRFTAWKNGDFDFEDDQITTVMRELARWYDIDVQYEGNITTEGFNAQISRQQNISVILRALERTNGVRFKIEGRRVTVIK